MRVQHRTSEPRAGFTLVELLVVMAIIVFLAAIVVAFLPSAMQSNGEADAAVKLQGWLNIARQNAIRNQNPYGVRLWVSNNAATTIGAGSNGQALAATTINVASTTGFSQSGIIAINIGGSLTFVSYIGLTPTSFIGCAGGTGTLATGQVVLGNAQATDCSYIEQPDDLTGVVTGSNIVSSGAANDTITFGSLDLMGGSGPFPGDPAFYPIQVGDNLEVLGTGLMHRVAAITSASTLMLATGLPFPINSPTFNYRVLRAPRAINTEKLSLPTDVIVDLGPTVSAFGFVPPPGNEPGSVDILFAPSGAIVSRVGTSYVALWVRLPDTATPDPSNPSPFANVFAGAPTVIAVWRDTGLVGAYPPVPGINPYQDIR
jgi:prepilin-type N-terminal cleavage/methylation domain-containing protein